MRILLVTPAASGSRVGNRVTALRMSGLLRGLGHEVKLRTSFDEIGSDLMIALHAGKSSKAIQHAAQHNPPIPSALVLTGTDIYREGMPPDPEIERALALATRLVILQPNAVKQLPEQYHSKTELLLQSATPRAAVGAPDPDRFQVCVLAHLRPVKDPLLTARAARLLPATSRIHVRLIGQALDEDSRREAEQEARENPRFEWLGPRSYGESQNLLANSRLLVLSSLAEGGPAVVTEAFAYGVPVLATRIPATEGLMGADHPGLYPVNDEKALAELLRRAEEDPAFLEELHQRSLQKQASTRPEREAQDLERLIQSLTKGRSETSPT